MYPITVRLSTGAEAGEQVQVAMLRAGPGQDMAPGEIHHYSFHEFATVQEAVSISVRPHPNVPRSVLVVENVQGVTGFPVGKKRRVHLCRRIFRRLWHNLDVKELLWLSKRITIVRGISTHSSP